MSTSNNKEVILSIIVPVYNVEKYLKRCLDSVLKQLKDNMELIVVDDGSKDSSGDICDEYRLYYGDRIRVIHQKNGGLSAARNTGIVNAKGGYLYFLDSDDYISDTFVETVYKYLIQNKYDIIEFKSYWQTKEEDISFRATGRIMKKSNLEMIDRILRNEIDCQIWLRIYRSNLFSNIRFPNGRNYEDIATYYKLLMNSNNNLMIDSQIHVYNLMNGNSITQTPSLKNLNDMYLAVNQMYDDLQKFLIDKNMDLTNLEYYKRHIYIYILLKLYKNDLKSNEIYSQIYSYLKANSKYNYVKYKNYDLKRLLTYKLLKLLGKL